MSIFHRFIHYLNRKNIMLFVGVALCVGLGLVALFAPLLELHDPTSMNFSQQFLPPSWQFPFGTDNLGRCIFSRVVEGTRVSLVVASLVVVLSVVIGTLVGLISGFVGGVLDTFLMRVVDIFLSFPTIVFALALSAVLGTGATNLIIALSLIMWTRFARLVRGEVVLLRNEEYIESARALGNSRGRIMVQYLLPQIASKVIVLASLDIGSVILFSSSLSFLGLGAQPPSPDWGAMISDAKNYLRFAPWMSIYPGLSIALSAISFNMLGDGLRDRIDPRIHEIVRAD